MSTLKMEGAGSFVKEPLNRRLLPFIGPTYGTFTANTTIAAAKTAGSKNRVLNYEIVTAEPDCSGVEIKGWSTVTGTRKFDGKPNIVSFYEAYHSVLTAEGKSDEEATKTVRALEGQNKDEEELCNLLRGKRVYFEAAVRFYLRDDGSVGMGTEVRGDRFMSKTEFESLVKADGSHRRKLPDIPASLPGNGAPKTAAPARASKF